MYLRILKKDLKRKKTMNVILLIFVALAAMFVASSVNNILTVTNSIDYYFEKAGAPDYLVISRNIPNAAPITEALDDIPEIDSFKTERVIYGNPDCFFFNGEKLGTHNSSVIMSIDDRAINYFDENNEVITSVGQGCVLLSGKAMENCGLKEGDEIEIRMEEVVLELKVLGGCKDAMLGSDMMGMTRFILNSSDFERLMANETLSGLYSGSLCYIFTGDIPAVSNALAEQNSIIFSGDMALIRMTYVMDMIVAGILLVVSVCLILIAFVVLRFTVSFTLTEEFREIGVMKAIGIRNVTIRLLYLSKYFLLSIVGAVIGFFASIPFADMLLNSVSQSMVMGNENAVFVNFLCCAGVVLIIMLFSYGCTGKVKKFTPIDAIRSGTTGERFTRKSALRLRSSRGKPSGFMALNDVLSSPKRFATIIFAFTLCLSLVLILVNTANTLASDTLIGCFSMKRSDVYMGICESEIMSFMTDGGKEKVQNKLAEIENTLAENDMSGKCCLDFVFKYNISHGEKSYKSFTFYGINTKTTDYEYFKGTPPQNDSEAAITELVADKLGADIGDAITIDDGIEKKDYIITALFQSMNNMGEGVRLHESAEPDFTMAAGFFAIQVDFNDDPNDAVIRERIEKLKEIFGEEKVYSGGEYIEHLTGVGETLNGVKLLTLSVVMIIIALVTVLMERSFITKERSEIAILKAIGFKTSAIVKWHTMRFGIVGVISTIAALILTVPLTNLAVTPIFKMMGATNGIEFTVDILQVFVIYPAAVLAVTVLSAMLTSLYTKKITASEASGIE